MKQFRFTPKVLLLIALTFSLVACNKKETPLPRHFNESELQTIDSILTFFDRFVWTQTNEQLEIGDAYLAYFEKVNPNIEQAYDFIPFIPSIEDRITLYESLNQSNLKAFFHISDSMLVKITLEEPPLKMYSPFTFELNVHGKFMAFLKDLSQRNDFFNSFYMNIYNSGEMSPANYAKIRNDFNQVDFNKKDERLAIVIALLRLGRKMDVTISENEILLPLGKKIAINVTIEGDSIQDFKLLHIDDIKEVASYTNYLKEFQPEKYSANTIQIHFGTLNIFEKEAIVLDTKSNLGFDFSFKVKSISPKTPPSTNSGSTSVSQKPTIYEGDAPEAVMLYDFKKI